MASVDSFQARLLGSGSHGAYPHTGQDPVAILGPVLNALYAIPSRRIDPLSPCVISVGEVRGGAAPNVIPKEIFLQGTIRAQDTAVREQLWAEVERALGLSRQLGGDYTLRIDKGYPSLYNDPEVNGWLRRAARQAAGEAAVVEHAFGMGAEDFAYMAQEAKGAMFMLGAARDDDLSRNHHTEIFDIDERVLPLGTAVLAETARRFVRGEWESSRVKAAP
jgi:amidohydrolase